MASVSSLGAGTSLDLGTLYSSLESAEQTRLTPITAQQTSYKAKLTAWGIVQTSLEKVQTAAKSLQDTKSIAQSKVTSTNSAFSATLANTASAGNYNVEVKQLATAQSLLSPAVSNKDTDLASGDSTITITQSGSSAPMTVSLSQDKTSLVDIRNAINAKQGNVTASIIKADDNKFYLSLTSRDTGTSNKMTITTSDDQLSGYISNSAMSEQMAAADAQLSVNGVDITRSSNTITDAPEGVTLTLNKATPGAAETLTVTKDNEPMVAAIKTFVDSYNSLQTTIKSQTNYNAVSAGSGAQSSKNGDLLGDGALRNIQNRLRSMLTTSQPGSDISSMSQMGITQDVSGKLTIDNTRLNKVLTEKPESVTAFLSGDKKTTGFATQTVNLLGDILASDGSVATATAGINSTLKRLSTTYDAVNASIAATMARYKKQFTQLSSLVSSLDNTSSFLSTKFNAMNNHS